MPGARLTGRVADDTYEGEVSLKVGPLGVAYTGRITLLETDRDERRLVMRAKGNEQHGAGNADAYVVATVEEEDGGAVVGIETELSIRGKVAQFGRGVIGEVTDGVMQTFAGNLAELLRGERSAIPTEPGPGTPTPPVAAPSDQGLDVWRLVVRPALARHGGSVATVAVAGVAAYLGARAGARRRRHR